MRGCTKPDVSYRVTAAGEIWAETATLREAQKEYTKALNIYWNTARDSVAIEKIQRMEIIRGRYF